MSIETDWALSTGTDMYGDSVTPRDNWCPCGEHLKGDGRDRCPSCEDKIARHWAEQRQLPAWLRGDPDAVVWLDNICRGQE